MPDDASPPQPVAPSQPEGVPAQPHPCLRSYAKLRDRIFSALAKPRRGWPLNFAQAMARGVLRVLDVPIRWVMHFADAVIGDRGYFAVGTLDADLQINIARSQLVAEEQRRITQRVAVMAPYLHWAAQQQNGAAISAPVLTPPHNNSFNCTALPMGGDSASVNCY
jgi:hypothetical protein